jgi:signal transduction histidine kinase
MMSHELRTPMTAVIGYTDLVLDGDLSVDQRAWMGKVKAASFLMLRILQNLIDLADLAGGRARLARSTFDVRVVLAAAMERLEAIARSKGLALGLDVDPRVPSALTGDAQRFTEIVEHLAGNALKFTAAGAIDVRVVLESSSPQVVVVRVSVTDTGIGIPQEAQARVREAFAVGDGSNTRRYGGAGLGLTLASELARLMGGGLELDSTAGIGTTAQFTVQLERAESPTRASSIACSALRRGP